MIDGTFLSVGYFNYPGSKESETFLCLNVDTGVKKSILGTLGEPYREFSPIGLLSFYEFFFLIVVHFWAVRIDF